MIRLSMPQQNIFDTEMFMKNTSVNCIGGYVTFNKKINPDILKKAINILIKNNDSIRIRLNFENGKVMQYVTDYKNETIEEIVVNTKEELEQKVDEIMREPIGLDGKLYDFRVIRLEDETVWLCKTHHLIADGWTIAMYLSDVPKYCEMLENGEEILPTVSNDYFDLIKREDEYLNSNNYLRDKEYWENKYAAKPTYVSLTSKQLDFDIAANRSKFIISAEDKNKMNEYCVKNNISLPVLFEAVVSLYATRTNNADDVTLCSLVLNRSGIKEKSTMGMYNNIVPMTVVVDWNNTFTKLCNEITKEHFQIFRHQRYPFNNIMKFIKGNYGQSNIYDIMVSYQVSEIKSDGDLTSIAHWRASGSSELGMMINIDDMNSSGELTVNIDYRKNCFEEEEVKNIYKRLINIINQVIANNEILVRDVEVVTPEEKNRILYEFNNTKKEYPSKKCVTEYITENAKLNPDKIALKFNGKEMTYKEFEEKTNALAHFIMENNKKRNAIIGVMCERSFEMMIAIYGIVKAGCAYMPMDSHFPTDRIQFMLEDSNSPMIITQAACIDKIPNVTKKINLDVFEYEKYENTPVKNDMNSEDTAYVIYTSGSTGKPKGAQIPHHSMINRIKWMHEKYPLGNEDVILQKTPYTFDVSVWELFWWSMYDASLEILVPEGHKDPSEIISAVENGKVTHMHFVPSMLNAFLEYLNANKNLVTKLKTLKYVFASGEALQSEHVRKFYNLLKENGTTLHNLYGPTECTVDVSYYDCDSENIPESIPIGKSIDNTELLILDRNLNLLPIGVAGELIISGVLVGKGYINRDELTKEKFVENKYFDSPKMYRTGDLAKWQEDGNIEYLGRMDNQVKIRGLRVELGDIETAILKNDNIVDCVVTVFEQNGEKNLCGYFTATSEVDVNKLKKELIKSLPEYMVPSYYVQLEKMPLNNNGKIDRKVLPLPQTEDEEEYVAPDGEIEEKIHEIITKVMKKDKISVEADLLNCGLSSLGVITIITELSMNDWNIKVKDFYEVRTIRDLATLIKNGSKETERDEDDLKYEYISDIRRVSIEGKENGAILLTGVTGFLGIHILGELLKNTDRKVYCLIRTVSKFEGYLEKFLEDVDLSRVIPIVGDITKDKLGLGNELYKEIVDNVGDIIHSAANVSYFCKWEQAKNINYVGTCNIIKLAQESKAKLHHISTMSVSGDVLTPQTVEYPKFDETKLFIGQLYKDNVYAHSKYLAEKEIIKAIRELRINASIYRIPNLAWRAKDGVFQENFYENDLYILTKVMVAIKSVPAELVDEDFLISPVDDVARAIVLLMNKKKNNDIYHLVSSYSLMIKDYIKPLIGEFEPLPLEEFYEKLISNSGDSQMQFVSMYLAGILSDPSKMIVHINSNRTNAILSELGYSWNLLDEKYVRYIDNINK